MGQLTKSTIVAVASSQVSCSLNKESVILNLADGAYYGLNRLGAAVWNLLQQPRPVVEIQQEILAAYEVEAERCDREVLELLDQLLSAGLIRVHEHPVA